jgi:hypothetical protein
MKRQGGICCVSVVWVLLVVQLVCSGGEVGRLMLQVEMIPALPGTPADFVVLLSNASSNHLVLLDETCSFGYNNLRLEVLDWPNSTNVIAKTSGIWYANWPRYVSVAAGGRIAIPVWLTTNAWGNLECLLRDVPWKRNLRAVYAQTRPMGIDGGKNGKEEKDVPLVPTDVPVFDGEVSSRLYPLEDIVPIERIRARCLSAL